MADRVILEFSAATDVRSGMVRTVEMLGDEGGVERVEWWAPAEDNSALRLEAACGTGGGRRFTVPVGQAGALIVEGGRWDSPFREALNRFIPILRRRWAEEELAGRAGRIVRQNEALEEFAALVAHELKRSLQSALLEDTPVGVRTALELIDSVLEAARSEGTVGASSSVADCLAEAVRDLGLSPSEIVAEGGDEFPLPSAALRLVLRNLVANALAAGARHIGVRTSQSNDSWTLVVDDDGLGLGASGAGEYAVGSGLGLSLCSRMVGRLGGSLELTANMPRGARATLVVAGS